MPRSVGRPTPAANANYFRAVFAQNIKRFVNRFAQLSRGVWPERAKFSRVYSGFFGCVNICSAALAARLLRRDACGTTFAAPLIMRYLRLIL